MRKKQERVRKGLKGLLLGRKVGRRVRIKPKKAKVIGIFSCKGGVGKTTTAVNLGILLAEKLGSKNVVVVEANLSAPNLGLHLGVTNPPITIHDVLAGRVPVEKAISVHESGLHYLAGTIAISEEVYLVDLKTCLEPLRKRYKLILLDSAPGLGPEVIASVKASDQLVIVTEPEVPTIAVTLRTFRAAERFRVPVMGVVVNKIRSRRYEIPIPEIRKTLGWPILAEIPDDNRVRESLTVGRPVVLYKPRSKAAKGFASLADTMGKLLSGRAKRSKM